ncbi:winged helix-turn-helix transcriptional regulator [Serratia oryzae]|uniref:Transcriptional regulator n=1 Tax=Serratia oryzae TaxID=2034155 RepID=A0A1S8CP82_9GAMM|nr:helix-turn-helix domain-containing protein [Serratia oryzae]OMQ25773.1 transcriptional regulator [Serratia oryzae]
MSKMLRIPPLSAELCGLAQAAEIIGDRWTLLILREAFYGVTRFEDLRTDIGASRHTLSSRLAAMVEGGLLSKSAYQEPGTRERYEYVLTEKGRSLGPILMATMEWGHKYLLGNAPHVMLTEKESGQPLQQVLITRQGKIVTLEQAQLTPTVQADVTKSLG